MKGSLSLSASPVVGPQVLVVEVVLVHLNGSRSVQERGVWFVKEERRLTQCGGVTRLNVPMTVSARVR